MIICYFYFIFIIMHPMVLASVHCLPDTDATVEGMCGDQLDEYTKPV